MKQATARRRPADRTILRHAAPELEANVTEPTIVRDAETGQPVFVLARYGGDLGALRRAARAYPPTTTYRMAGTRNVSRTFGFSATRAPMRRSSCRPCSGAVDVPEVHATIASAAADLAATLAVILPDRAREDDARARAVIRDEWMMGGWWTSGVVNFNSPLPYHYDANNLACWSAMPVMRRGVRGGHLHLPEYDLVVGCRDGDVCFFAGWNLMHATTPLRMTAPDAYRISAVYYTVAGMAKCTTRADELAVGRARQSEAEDNMRARQERSGVAVMPAVEIRTYIISSRRPESVPETEAWCTGLDPTWVVPPGEGETYSAAGAGRVDEADGKLVAQRNRAIDLAGDAWCLQVDDDLRSLRWTTGTTKADTHEITMVTAAFELYRAAEENGVHLAGIAPTANPFYYGGRPVKLAGFVIGDIMLIDPASEPRFDPAFPLKEDYDFTLQHLDRYGAVARVDAILATFRHRTNAGGAVAYRTDDMEADACARLFAKWPGRIVPNPRRKNEVLVRWPQPRRANR